METRCDLALILPMPFSRIEVVRRLVLLRESLGLEAAELCRQTGLAENRWSQYESGKRPITLAAAIILRERYGATLDWIYCGDESGLPQRLVGQMRKVAQTGAPTFIHSKPPTTTPLP